MTTPPHARLPHRADGLALAALLFAALCTLSAYGATSLVAAALGDLGVMNVGWKAMLWLSIAATACLFLPAVRALTAVRRASTALATGDLVSARIETAAAREHGWLTFGWGAFALIILGFASFVVMNDVAVGHTFFFLPLIQDKWWQVTRQFLINNIFIFVVAEILVLAWGLVVALARLMPGRAGQPIRALAILYCDIFRGLPAIVTLYLIGFGIPTSGLPDLIVPHIVGLFTDLSAMTVAEQRAATRIPVMWWCILALTLTYGAYVAEVYRAGIDSIHWSQIAAARSLGLSYMQTMRYVVVPQAVRRILAPLLNDFIGLQKDTALVQVVGVIDAFNQSRIIASNAFNLSAVTIVAILFVIITIPQARFVDRLIDRDNARMRAGG
ncbi:amino acid ABC transporter permease [Aestuariivirga sp.]|uniref:amino acid ABC transporter permease n=1 Tax=Aestuariivirga sp. TaxID=2650926 RepID=UPI003783CA7C